MSTSSQVAQNGSSSPAHPESAETDSSPRDAPFRRQGRSERRGEDVRPALRGAVRPCHGSWRTENPPVKNPALPGGAFVNQEGICLRFATGCHSSPLFLQVIQPFHIEPLSDTRTPHGKRRVLARMGRAGEKATVSASCQRKRPFFQKNAVASLEILEESWPRTPLF